MVKMCWVIAQTGSGKTAVCIAVNKQKSILIKNIRNFCDGTDTSGYPSGRCVPKIWYEKFKKSINIVTVYGGQRYDIQLRALKQGAQVVVGTPGRILDHIRLLKHWI